MDEKDLPSCSDDSDADFVPKDEECNSESGSEVSDFEESEGEDKNTKSRKRKKGSRRPNKKAKIKENENLEEETPVEETEEKKIDVDALWADFKKDVNNADNKKESSKTASETETGNKSTDVGSVSVQNNSQVKTNSVPSLPIKNRGGGLSSVLNKIGKKDKMSTLQKSQLDWNNFKKSQGIEEEIKLYNKGKDGYLDKQDFLQRTDLRQFEIEKDLRSTRRKF